MRFSRGILIALALPVLLLSSGCQAKPPSRVERVVVTKLKHWVTVRGKSDVNPLEASAENISEGKKAFSSYCAACHGLDAQNTGVPFVEKMSPPIPSLASSEVQEYSDGQLKWVIDNGLFPSGMPASKHVLSDEEIWSIVVYLRHLPSAGSLGEPVMYSGETCEPPATKPLNGQ